MRSLLRLSALCLLLVVAAATAAVAQAAEPETNECANLASCTSIPITPWVALAAVKNGFTETNQGIEEAGTALWRVDCPGNKVPAGRDFIAANPESPPTVNASIPPFNTGITGGPVAVFFGFWQGPAPTSFRPLVGCIPKAAAASATVAATAARPRQRLRTVTRTLHPGQDKTYVHHCAKGEQLIGSGHGVAFYRDTPPPESELRGLEVERTERHGRVVVHVHTSAKVGAHERVSIQIHALCRAGA